MSRLPLAIAIEPKPGSPGSSIMAICRSFAAHMREEISRTKESARIRIRTCIKRLNLHAMGCQREQFCCLPDGPTDLQPLLTKTKAQAEACALQVPCYLIVIFQAEVRDQFLALQVSQRVLQLHELNEQMV